ncbi:MDIS1-interacting receptor like kinase 2, partial [Cucurbita argyrosperma subsp. argyrosperma]
MAAFSLMSFLLLLCYHLLSAPFPISLEASTPSPLQLEADALQQSGWWSGRNISQHCQWKTSIICDASGSIIDIFVDWALPAGSTLHNLNFSSLPNLVSLYIFNSTLQGTIPPQIALLSNLTFLHLSRNHLTGHIPLEIGNLTNLLELHLDDNMLTGSIPLEIGNLSRLSKLRLHRNLLTGTIPLEIGKLMDLMELRLDRNMLHGTIPSQMGNFTNLFWLSLSQNMLMGTIPSTLYRLPVLSVLDISGNRLSGVIPTEIGNITNLRTLSLGDNNLTGPFPLEIKSLYRLEQIYVQNNALMGLIPSSVFQLTSLKELNLASNNFIGSIPSEITHSLQFLNASCNMLTGSIPFNLFDLISYQYWLQIDLSHNSFNGPIPSMSMGSRELHGVTMNLSYNKLTGSIPDFLIHFQHIDLSYNSFHGPLSSEFLHHFGVDVVLGNENLCGNHSQLRSCASHNHTVHKLLKILLLSLILFILLVVCFTLYCSRKSKNTTHVTEVDSHGNVFSIWNYDGKIAYQDIIDATEDFDIKYCIGTGGFGSVYRATLPIGKVVALKKLHSSEAAKWETLTKSFQNEIEMLKEIRHKNIVKLLGYCLHKRCMFLIYEYMESGSLFWVLSNDTEAEELKWNKRLNVINRVAQALSYLHHDCNMPIIHRDVTTNNILLDSNFDAFLSDFGVARFLDVESSNHTVIHGTYGYIAPAQSIVLVLTLAFACFHPNPKARPTMQHVSREFVVPRLRLEISFNEISVEQILRQEIYHATFLRRFEEL